MKNKKTSCLSQALRKLAGEMICVACLDRIDTVILVKTA